MGTNDTLFPELEPKPFIFGESKAYEGRANSAHAFYCRDTEKKKPTQREQVLRAIKLLRLASDKDVMNVTQIPVHTVSARRNELLELKLIEDAGEKIDPNTNKPVRLYKVKE